MSDKAFGMLIARRILGQIVADHGGLSYATPDRIGRITKDDMNRVDLLTDLVNSIGDWFQWTTDQKIGFVNEARKEWLSTGPENRYYTWAELSQNPG